MPRGRLQFGTSSFSERSWVGAFYPEGTAPTEFLSFYATQFAAVEIDATYYAIPDDRVVDGWASRTPERFKICAKFPRSIVHGGSEAQPDAQRVLVPEVIGDDVERFLTSMARLGDRLGPLVLQLPYFNRDAFDGPARFLARLGAFLERLPPEFRYAVEIRNKSWIGRPLLDLLRAHRTALVLVDLAYMPHPADLQTRLDLTTTDFVYTRLIGDRKAVDAITEDFDRIVVDQTRRLGRWATLLEGYLARGIDTWVFANNHYAGHAPATIRDLVDRVEALSSR
jgi:uncharacterized protein YecE (DUF72 family)